MNRRAVVTESGRKVQYAVFRFLCPIALHSLTA